MQVHLLYGIKSVEGMDKHISVTKQVRLRGKPLTDVPLALDPRDALKQKSLASYVNIAQCFTKNEDWENFVKVCRVFYYFLCLFVLNDGIIFIISRI